MLAYASICFEKCTNPFERIHLLKMKVSADECKELSSIISDILKEEIMLTYAVTFADFGEGCSLYQKSLKKFMETQR